MEVTDPAFLAHLDNRSAGHRLMGLDLGTRTIGIAFSDARLKIATARETLQRTKFTEDAGRLIALAENEAVCAIVIGLPLNMDGSQGPRAQSTRAFVSNFSRLSDLPVAFHDERLSTHEAEQAMIGADVSRQKRKQKIDAVAAAVILQSALDAIAQARR